MLAHAEKLARWMAILGGVVLVALVLLTFASVLGRGLNTFGHSEFLVGLAPGLADALIASGVGPINGDFEIAEAGIAFAICAFLPICQLHGGHASVDIFTSFLSARVNRIILAFWEVILTATIILITWRLLAGMQSKMDNGETTFMLQFPVWWAYAASGLALVVASFVGVYCAYARLLTALTGRRILSSSEGASH